MTPIDFRDVTAGFQSIAIVLATVLGGAWALWQFFSLRALERTKLGIEKEKKDLEKARKELIERAILIIDLVTESFDVDGSYFLHVRVGMRNEGNGVEVADWRKAQLFARRFHKLDATKLETVGDVLPAWRAPSISIAEMRFLPNFSTNESFLIAIPEAGVYYVEFTIPVSPAARLDTLGHIEQSGAKVVSDDVVLWRADTFVTVPTSAQPGASAGGPASLRSSGRG